MDARVRAINTLVRSYDSKLKAARTHDGVIRLYRKRAVMDAFSYGGVKYLYTRDIDDYVVSLTDTWGADGRAVDWGLDPLWRKLQQMDSWRDDTGYKRFTDSRERYLQDKDRMLRNNIRAHAADLRRDFAKATNDITIRQETLDKNKNY